VPGFILFIRKYDKMFDWIPSLLQMKVTLINFHILVYQNQTIAYQFKRTMNKFQGMLLIIQRIVPEFDRRMLKFHRMAFKIYR